MSLISLDTPQIHLLERVRRNDPVRYSSFRGTWNRRGHILVFTTTQAGELRRYENASGREARYQVLADLTPIRTDLPVLGGMSSGPRTFIEREIARAIVERDLVKPTNPEVHPLAKWTEVLPVHLGASEVDRLRLIEGEVYLDMLKRQYDAARFQAAAAKAHSQTKNKERVRDLSSVPLPPGSVLAARTEMERQFASILERSQRGELPPISSDALAPMLDKAVEFIARMGEIGARDALLERLPVTRLTEAERLKTKARDLVECFVFEFCVRNFGREVLNLDEPTQEFLVRTLEPADCPGFWLQRRLELCVRRGCPEPRPNHHFDVERLAYLPYVDLLLTDKEMVEFVRQIRNDKSTPERIRSVRPAVSIADSMDALEEALDSLRVRSEAAASA